jgi:hypothetical protein
MKEKRPRVGPAVPDGQTVQYLHSMTFWNLIIGGPVLWALVVYLCAQIFIPGFR